MYDGGRFSGRFPKLTINWRSWVPNGAVAVVYDIGRVEDDDDGDPAKDDEGTTGKSFTNNSSRAVVNNPYFLSVLS